MYTCVSVLQGHARLVSSTRCVWTKTESFGVPATPYNATARTGRCAERTERHTSTTVKGNCRSAGRRRTFLLNNKGLVVSGVVLLQPTGVVCFWCVSQEFCVKERFLRNYMVQVEFRNHDLLNRFVVKSDYFYNNLFWQIIDKINKNVLLIIVNKPSKLIYFYILLIKIILYYNI